MTDPFGPPLFPGPEGISTPQGFRYLNPYTGQYTIGSQGYAHRIQRGYARGLGLSEARSHGVTPAGLNESQVRRANFERKYGFSYNEWARWQRKYIAAINNYAWPDAPSRRMNIDEEGNRRDPRVHPEDITATMTLYVNGFRDPIHSSPPSWQEWVEIRLAERLNALEMYHEFSDPRPGRVEYNSQSRTWLNLLQLSGAAAPPIELWWYH